MTVVIVNQAAAHSVRLSSARTSALIVCKSIGRFLKVCGHGLADASSAYAQALELALVKACGVSEERQRLARDADGEGRNPSW